MSSVSSAGAEELLHERDDLVFRPVPVVLRRRGPDEPAMPAVFSDRQLDMRIARDLWVPERGGWHEGIVFSRDYESRHADAIDDAHRACAMVVIVGATESKVGRGVRLVELTHRSDRRQRADVESPRPASVLAPHT